MGPKIASTTLYEYNNISSSRGPIVLCSRQQYLPGACVATSRLLRWRCAFSYIYILVIIVVFKGCMPVYECAGAVCFLRSSAIGRLDLYAVYSAREVSPSSAAKAHEHAVPPCLKNAPLEKIVELEGKVTYMRALLVLYHYSSVMKQAKHIYGGVCACVVKV